MCFAIYRTEARDFCKGRSVDEVGNHCTSVWHLNLFDPLHGFVRIFFTNPFDHKSWRSFFFSIHPYFSIWTEILRPVRSTIRHWKFFKRKSTHTIFPRKTPNKIRVIEVFIDHFYFIIATYSPPYGRCHNNENHGVRGK